MNSCHEDLHFIWELFPKLSPRNERLSLLLGARVAPDFPDHEDSAEESLLAEEDEDVVLL